MERKIIMDWEHQLLEIIDNNKDNADFPSAEKFGTSLDEVKEYAYDKQRILDREEERKKKLVIPGIILVMPVIILSGIRNDTITLLIGVGIGLFLVFIYYTLMSFIDHNAIKKMRNDSVENYISAVMEYVSDKKQSV